MATRVMIIWILVLQVMWAGVFVFFSGHFDGAAFERKRVAVLEKKLHKNVRVLARLEMNFSEYKDTLAASGVKINDKTKWTDPTRMVASVMADPEFKAVPKPQPGNTLFNQANRLFVAGDYKRAAELFQDFIEKYPDHPELPKATYLLSESCFHEDQLEAAVKNIDSLITHFPETEFAGYGLVRLGKIYERQERPEEAAEMYDVVMKHYPKSNAAAIAEKNRKELNL